MKNSKGFETDYMPFLATALLTDSSLKVNAEPHPDGKYPGQLTYYLTPFDRAIDLYRRFQQDEFKLSPRLVALKIIELKNMNSGMQPMKNILKGYELPSERNKK